MGNQKTERLEQTHSMMQNDCPIVELRQYTLHPGQRDVLIDLFDREFIESQEALGMRVIGQFRDLDDPNRFVWLRGFHDMPIRAQALAAFYDGPVWKMYRELANSTMVDSSNVLLLRPACQASGFSSEIIDRPSFDTTEVPNGLVVATIYYFDAPASVDFLDFFERSLKPELIETGALILAYFVTESSENNFPALPVREGENLFMWFSIFSDQEAYECHIAALARSDRWHNEILEELAYRLIRPVEVKKLLPTMRSQLKYIRA
jgi:quinol monooxygenase YgiN